MTLVALASMDTGDSVVHSFEPAYLRLLAPCLTLSKCQLYSPQPGVRLGGGGEVSLGGEEREQAGGGEGLQLRGQEG